MLCLPGFHRNRAETLKGFFLCRRRASPRRVCTCGPSALVLIRLFTESWPKITCSCSVYRLPIKCACRQSGPATGCKASASLYPRLRQKGLADLVKPNTGVAVREARSPSCWRQTLKILSLLNIITHFMLLFTHYMSLFLHCVYVTNWTESDVSVKNECSHFWANMHQWCVSEMLCSGFRGKVVHQI